MSRCVCWDRVDVLCNIRFLLSYTIRAILSSKIHRDLAGQKHAQHACSVFKITYQLGIEQKQTPLPPIIHQSITMKKTSSSPPPPNQPNQRIPLPLQHHQPRLLNHPPLQPPTTIPSTIPSSSCTTRKNHLTRLHPPHSPPPPPIPTPPNNHPIRNPIPIRHLNARTHPTMRSHHAPPPNHRARLHTTRTMDMRPRKDLCPWADCHAVRDADGQNRPFVFAGDTA